MRFGLVVDVADSVHPLTDLVRQVTAAEELGFDIVWLQESDAIPSPAAAAAALAPHTSSIHVGAALQAGVNPVYLAEEAAVADLCLGGRLVLGLGSPDAGLLGETLDVVLAATAARPFRHEGERWQIPANLPENVVNREERVRVTPATAALELPIWLTGPQAPPLARESCLTFVGSADEPTDVLALAWQDTVNHLGRAAGRLRRVAVRTVTPDRAGTVDDEAVVQQLRADQRGWGMDVVLVRLPAGTAPEARPAVLNALAQRVVPRLQLDRLPPGLEQYWKQRQETT